MKICVLYTMCSLFIQVRYGVWLKSTNNVRFFCRPNKDNNSDGNCINPTPHMSHKQVHWRYFHQFKVLILLILLSALFASNQNYLLATTLNNVCRDVAGEKFNIHSMDFRVIATSPTKNRTIWICIGFCIFNLSLFPPLSCLSIGRCPVAYRNFIEFRP